MRRSIWILKWICTAVLMISLIGCATHYVRQTDDGLVFYLEEPSAAQVELLASFNGFSPLPAARVNPSIWRVTVPSNDSFSYFYRIDGRIHVPDCELKERDDFGQDNCIFERMP